MTSSGAARTGPVATALNTGHSSFTTVPSAQMQWRRLVMHRRLGRGPQLSAVVIDQHDEFHASLVPTFLALGRPQPEGKDQTVVGIIQ
jgi:hypothetical protein